MRFSLARALLERVDFTVIENMIDGILVLMLGEKPTSASAISCIYHNTPIVQTIERFGRDNKVAFTLSLEESEGCSPIRFYRSSEWSR